MQFPRLMIVRQKFADRGLQDVAAETRKQLALSGFAARLKPGSRVAIGVGSRGIRNLAQMVGATVAYWKEQGMKPFLFPAMGSHGAATAEGQSDVLAHYGITGAAMGCPLVSSLEVVSLGKTADGIEAFMDRNAWESDGVFLINRVKWHTDFAGKLESGLFKMMAIGIGKFAGAQQYHSFGFKVGLEHVVRTVGRQVLQSGKVLGGLAILEDAYHNTAKLEAVPVESMEHREEELLETVKSWMAKLPTDMDVLILDHVGKDVSGAGMDTKVVNRSIVAEYNPWPFLPRVERIMVRGVSANSYGNAVGIGMADVAPERILKQIDWGATRINSFTANTPANSRMPNTFPSDRECLERIAATVGKRDMDLVTFGWIHNSLELARLGLSENLRPRIEENPEIEIEAVIDFDFDAENNLISPFAPVEAGAH